MTYPDLQVDFNNPVSDAERAEISAVCLTFRDNTQVLRDTKCDQVMVYRGGRWWHTTPEDPRLHVTVRYNRYSARRCHIYQDGTGTIRPPGLTNRITSREEVEGSDWSDEFSDREEDKEDPEYSADN